MNDDSAETIAKSARGIDDPKARRTFIQESCRGQSDLIESVERLLSGDQGSDDDGFFFADDGSGLPFEQAGEVIGRYRLVREIGQGGFGSVWLADQFEPVKRQVALKIIKLGMDTRQVVARFEQERQALALMDHPNIARVLDAGATKTGRPYFVMDLVQGVPVVDYCDKNDLSVARKLELFAQICTAVQHAHGKGIIHRDLKPSNILVGDIDGKPHVTIIDFGIAKATSARLTNSSFATAQHQVVGTLHYMSPEQVEGSLEIDTRTDIYALGVILYELLTGATPFDDATLRRRDLSEIQKLIREVDPPRPSRRVSESGETLANASKHRRVSTQRLTAVIRNDLDWIVMRAMEKERIRRYDTASDLAADVRRFLAGEAVVAAPPSRTYRLRKFVLRNRLWVAASSVVVLTLVVGIIGTTWGMLEAREQRRRAENAVMVEIAERRQAEAVADLLQRLMSGINPEAESEGGLSFKEQLLQKLDEAVANLDGLSGDPLVKARLQESLGTSLLALSEYRKAEALLLPAHQARKTRLGEHDPRTAAVATLLGVACQHQGRYQEALAWVERGNLVGATPIQADALSQDHIIGMIHQGAGDLDRASEIFERVHDRLKAADRLDTDDGMLAAHTLGATLREMGRIDEAIALLEDARERRTRVLGADHPETLMTLNSLAVAYSAAGRVPEAVKLGEDVRARYMQRYPPDHVAMLSATANLAVNYGKMGRHKEGIELLEDLQTRAMSHLGAANPSTNKILAQLSGAYYGAGRIADAIRVGAPALETAVALYGSGNPRNTNIVETLSRSYQRVGRTTDAVLICRTHAEAMSKNRGQDDDELLDALTTLAVALRAAGSSDEAIAMLKDVIARRTSTKGENDSRTVDAWELLGSTLHRLGRSQEAVEIFERIVQQRKASLGPDHRATLRAQSSLAACYWARGKLEQSIPLMEATLAAQVRMFGMEDGEAIETAKNLFVNYGDAGRVDAFADHVLAWYVRFLDREEPDSQEIERLTANLVGACRQLKREPELIPPLEARLDRLTKKLGDAHRRTVQTATYLGRAYRIADRNDDSVKLLLSTLARARSAWGEKDIDTLRCCAHAASALLMARRPQEAIPLYEAVLQAARTPDGAVQAEFAGLEYLLGVALKNSGQLERAEREFERLLAKAKTRRRVDVDEIARTSIHLATCQIQRSDHAAAEATIRDVVAERMTADPSGYLTGQSRSLLGEALFRQGRFEEAEAHLVQGSEAIAATFGANGVFGPDVHHEALQRLVDFHRARHTAEPSRGFDKAAAAWQEKLEAARGEKKGPADSAPTDPKK